MNDFLPGLISGITQTITGHPLDTLKTYKQFNKPFNLSIKNSSKLYFGITGPLLTNSATIGAQFYFYHNYNSFIASIVSGLLIGPIEFYKIQKQITGKYNFKILPKGIPITIMREIVAINIYFNSYYYLKNKINNDFLTGGIVGVASWFFCYPFDVMKTRIQQGIKYRKAYEMRNFSKGLGLCLSRAFLVNSCGFYVMEQFKNKVSLNN